MAGLLVKLALDQTDRSIGRVTACKGKETHLCGEDLYKAAYCFAPVMVGAVVDDGEWLEVCYGVKESQKGYVS